MLHELRERMNNDDRGFTLVELLVVVIIIGILAAIAIPVILSQRQRAWERAVLSDVRNAAVVLAEIDAEDGSYAAAAAGSPYTETTQITAESGTAVTLVVSMGVELAISTADGGAAYTIRGTHEWLDGIWTLDSRTGLIEVFFE